MSAPAVAPAATTAPARTAGAPPERRAAPAGGLTTAARTGRAGRVDRAVVAVLVVLVVLTSRLGLPVGDATISVAVPLAYAGAVVLLVRGTLRVDRLRAELYLAAVLACLAATLALSFLGDAYSFTSYLLLVAIYLPWVLGAGSGRGHELVTAAGRAFCGVMVVVSVVGVLQLVAQLAGAWTYTDLLAQAVSPTYLIPDYHIDNPLGYGSSTFKGNGVVLLEPSFLSQYSALALLIGLQLRVRAWRLLVYLAGVGAAVSGTGVLLLAVGAALVLVRTPRLLRPSVLVAIAAGAAAVLLSPVSSVLLGRSGELGQSGSSGNARFIEPYVEAARGLGSHPLRYLTGGGAGESERLLSSGRFGGGQDVLYSVVPKVLFEYGLLAGGLVLLFLVLATLERSPWRVVPGALLVMTFLLSGALLQPQTAYLVWLLSAIGSASRPRLTRLHGGREVRAPAGVAEAVVPRPAP